MGKNEEKKRLGIIQQITKNVNSKQRKCLLDSCEEIAINSHLLQVNGILDNIMVNGHLYQIKANDYFKIEKEGYLSLKKIGINNAMSEFLFCNQHDTLIFKNIESENIDFYSYNSQLLFSYRSLCCELRKKEKNLDIFTRTSNSNILNIEKNEFNYDVLGTKYAIKDLMLYKKLIEEELNLPSEAFIFKTLEYPLIEISVSAIFSPLDPNFPFDELVNHITPLNNCFINVIPQKEKLIIITGYHKDHYDDWILNYINSWQDLSYELLQRKLTDLITTRVETWCLSEKLMTKIDKQSIELFKAYWNENGQNIDSTQKIYFNLFECLN